MRDYKINGVSLAGIVRDQGNNGACWAFGATGALESAFLRQIKNTVKVKQVLKLYKVKVKKSAKKLVIKAQLKNKKAIKGKKLIFKFNGKKYTEKTNKKRIATITIKKSVLKKLKVGKKVKYQVTYLKDTVKKSVKVKK